jgi:hypothetical protein
MNTVEVNYALVSAVLTKQIHNAVQICYTPTYNPRHPHCNSKTTYVIGVEVRAQIDLRHPVVDNGKVNPVVIKLMTFNRQQRALHTASARRKAVKQSLYT